MESQRGPERPKNTSQGNENQEERIVSAALEYKGQVFNGQTHLSALEELQKVYPGVPEAEHVRFGFVTSTGRFVDEYEAKEVAKKASQIRGPERDRLYSDEYKE